MNNMIKIAIYRCLLLVGSVFFSLGSSAQGGGVSLIPTRIIFNAADKARSLKIKNRDDQVYLIQTGSQIAPDDSRPAPFVVIPPIFRLEPGSENSLRILRQTGSTLPHDRESVFYLSVLAIPAGQVPPSHHDDEGAQLSMGFRFYIKLIYRPADLSLTPQEAACRLRLIPQGKSVRVENPTPYALTLAGLRFDRQPVNLERQPSMIVPFGQQDYPARQPVTQADWQVVTDNGDISARCQRPISQQ